ncbi:MAG: alpha-ketoglutarate-dependent dioxygenase AlkB, partial [Cyanobacteriota bacterium]
MQLFENKIDFTKNLLPKNGTVNYYGKIFSLEDSNRYLDIFLQNIEWKNDEAIIFGKLIVTKRKVAWYGD